MNTEIASNAGNSTDWAVTFVIGSGEERRTALSPNTEPRKALRASTTGVTGLQQALITQLSSVKGLEALAEIPDEEVGKIVFVVVRDHSVEVSGQVVELELRLREQHPDAQFEIAVRASQGRHPWNALPFGSRLLYIP